MKKIPVQELSREAFRPYGDYVQLIRPDSDFDPSRPVSFTPDMLTLDLQRFSVASFSICRVSPRERTVGMSEYHSYTSEGICPLDGDILIHVGKPGPKPLADTMAVFRVPYGTMVTLKPGVYHMGPFSEGDKAVNVIIVLPVRTYANDCIVVKHEDDQVFTF